MYNPYPLIYSWVLLITIVASTPVNLTSSSVDLIPSTEDEWQADLSWALNDSMLSTMSNLSTGSVYPGKLNATIASCKPREYGRPIVSSCEDALDQIPVDFTEFRFGLRSEGTYEQYSPLRFLNCKFMQRTLRELFFPSLDFDQYD